VDGELDEDVLGRIAARAFGKPSEEDHVARGDAPAAERELGRFLLVERLGSGGAGVVWRGFDPWLGRFVALKTLAPDVAGGPGGERFLREARTAARLRHPGIAAVHEVGVLEGQPYYTMDLVAGVTLEVWRRTHSDPREIARVGAKLARALHEAHQSGIIHRDVKPSNVIVGQDGSPVLVDFGLAREVAGADLITETGVLVGTPAFMSPEQASGARTALDARTDVYSLGATLSFALTGSLPVEAAELPVLVAKIASGETVSPRARRHDVPAELEAIVLMATARRPDERYASALALAEDLEAFVAGAPTLAVSTGGFARRLARLVRSRRGLLVATVCLAALGVGMAIADLSARSRLGIVIDSPREDETVFADEVVRVTGRVTGARPSVWIRVNDVAARESGRFAVLWVPTFESPELRVVATGSDGSRAAATRRVRVDAHEAQWFVDMPPGERPALPPGMRAFGLPRVYRWTSRRGVVIEMVHVPPGPFFMGPRPGEFCPPGVVAHVHPMPRAYWISRTEITLAQYRVFCEDTGTPLPRPPSKPGWPTDNESHPVVTLTWTEADLFCKWAGGGLRLPTEPEWEKAARGGGADNARNYPWGDENPALVCKANFCDRGSPLLRDPAHHAWAVLDDERPIEVDDQSPFTSDVTAFPTDESPFGAHGMAGNVAEMCDDWYEEAAYVRYASGDLSPPREGPFSLKVVRGGAWGLPWWNCKVATRNSPVALSTRSDYVGFRVVLPATE
jgi:formylglycine-generating enzyme required for sulfatase activity